MLEPDGAGGGGSRGLMGMAFANFPSSFDCARGF
jgi:hypothetical protein